MTAADAWQPAATRATLATRAAMLATARQFFAARGILEVETPVLCRHGVTDPHIRSIATAPDDRSYWLRSSPEFHMKRLLAAGYGDIYQIGKAFRGSESGPRHEPEFTMIEWYRLGFDLADIIAESCELIIALSGLCKQSATTVNRISYSEAFDRTCGIDPLTASVAELRSYALQNSAVNCDERLAELIGAERQGWLDLLAVQQVYPSFTDGALWVLDQYPADQALLAQLNPDNTAVAERFEIFWNGVELANGFRELRDADEQRERFTADQQLRLATDSPAMTIDDQFIAALEHGLPDCAGVAVGFDRILLVATELASLDETMSFAPGS